MSPNQLIGIYLSCSPQDEELGSKLAKHLRALEHDRVISVWQNSDISAGAERVQQIESGLNSAHIILLLISPDFFASDEHWKLDVPKAIERHKTKEACVIPVLLRPYDWKGSQFGGLQALPRNEKAITSWQNQDEAFKEVAEEIRKAIEKKSDYISLPEKDKRQFKIPWRDLLPVLKASMGVTFLVVVMRLFGVVQASELWVFDKMMQLQPIEEQDDRLLVVEVTKKDIDKQKDRQRGPSLTDETLLNLLKELLKNQPRAIGLDIHRDFETKPINESSKQLSELLKKNPLIFSVCNVGDLSQKNDGVSPPPEIPRERLGFSDFLSDSEGIVRRQVLTMSTSGNSPCWSLDKKPKKPVDTAFSLQLALHYLKEPYEGLFKKGNKYLRLKDTDFQLLYGSNRGGYSIWTDLDGYQLLLNYRRSCYEEDKNICSPEFITKRFSVEDVLRPGLLEKNPLKDKIVLVGVRDVSYENPWFTPFSSGGNQPIPGVVIQAQMVSQILSAVLDQRPLLKVWPIWHEMIWIFGWALLGGSIAYFCPSKRYLMISGGAAFIILYVVCLIFFISPIKYWIPFVPPALTLLGTGGVVVLIRFKA